MCAKSEEKIACPSCQWEPDGEAYWQCTCGQIWDTFSTGAICPSCQKKHKYTQCPSCGSTSLHVDWYHFPIDSFLEEFKEAYIEITRPARP